MRASVVGTTVAAAVAAAVVMPASVAVARSGDTVAPKIVSVSAPSIVGLTPQGAAFSIDVHVTDNIDVAQVMVGVLDSTGKVGKGFLAEIVEGTSGDSTFRAKIVMPRSVPLGSWKVRAVAEDPAGNVSAGMKDVRDTFVLKPATQLKLNAGPEPVVKGAVLAVKGSLRQASAGAWTGYAGRTVTIQFKKAGQGWVSVANVITGASGAYSYTTKAKSAGAWRAVYAGDAAKAKSTSKQDKIALA